MANKKRMTMLLLPDVQRLEHVPDPSTPVNPSRFKAVRSVAYAAAVLADTPKAYYKCDDASGNPQDSSGNALHMTTTSSGVTYQDPGPFGPDFCIRWNLKSTSRNAVSTVQSNWTLECWCKFNALNGSTVMCGNGGTNGWEMYLPTTTNIGGIAQGVGGQTASGFTLSTGVWYHLVVQKQTGAGGLWLYYINGRPDMTRAGTSNPTAPGNTPGTTMNRANTGDISMAHFALYETALSATRILAHYEAGL
jgi:hypothetical protein